MLRKPRGPENPLSAGKPRAAAGQTQRPVIRDSDSAAESALSITSANGNHGNHDFTLGLPGERFPRT